MSDPRSQPRPRSTPLEARPEITPSSRCFSWQGTGHNKRPVPRLRCCTPGIRAARPTHSMSPRSYETPFQLKTRPCPKQHRPSESTLASPLRSGQRSKLCGRLATSPSPSLADAHGVSPRAIPGSQSKRGIIKGSKGAELAEAVREEIVALELGDKDLTANRARKVRETAYEHAQQIEQLVMAQIALAQREPGQILRVASALKGLSLAAGTLERLHGLNTRAMGLDRHVEERELPKLTIDCYTDDEPGWR